MKPTKPGEGYRVLKSKSAVFYDRYERKADLQQQTHYCPGCGHGIAHKLIAETLQELGLSDRAIFVSPVGCSVFGYYYFHVGNVQAAHGRAPAVATALKRSHPGSIVIAYQGDGDLAAIGTAEIIHAANRGEPFTVFFVNNAIYGMTGGQLAPTTLVGQFSTTTPWGRRPANEGYPIHMAELLATLDAPAYIERVSLAEPKEIMRARKAVRKALELQRDGKGFSFVEILSPCPTVWKMTPAESRAFMKEKMLPIFPLKRFRDGGRLPEPGPEPPKCTVPELLGLDGAAGSAAADAARRPQGKPLSIKIAGFGGQGVLLLGQILAEMGMREGFNVSWLPSYGPEMRSGSAHCHVCLSPDRIGSPLISHPDVLIAMNEISLRKFASEVPARGLILYNHEKLPEGFAPPAARVVCVPASEIADRMGQPRTANVVMLGALLEETDCLSLEAAGGALATAIKKAGMLEANRKALEAGAGFALLTESLP